MRLLNFFAISAAAMLLAGCAGYRLGPVNGAVAGDKSVEIQPFNNQTLQPRLGDSVTQILREELQTDGTYHLATHSNTGDIVVSGIITQYQRSGVSYQSQDVATAQDYRISVIAHVIARERSTGKILVEKDVTGYTLIRVGVDLNSAERQSMPLLAQDLARNIAQLLTEGSW
ncbi:MAG: LPS assembly lipoprotein LptE [Limisphaerales bacterium]